MSGTLLAGEMLAALTLGLLSAPHCIAMCGGLMSAFSLSPSAASSATRTSVVVHYSLGRLSGYMILGAIAGLLGLALSMSGSIVPMMLRSLAGVMLILLGLYTLGSTRILRRLESSGYGLWQSLMNSVGRIDLSQGRQQFVAGILWGWLPCGVVYSVLAMAMATGHPLSSSLVMLSFGVGTLPAVAGTGFAAGGFINWLKHRYTRLVVGVSLIGFGIWTLSFVVMAAMKMGQHMGH